MYSEDPCSGSRQYDIQTWGQKSVRCAHGSWTKNQKLLTPLQIPWNNLSSMEGITFQVSSSSHILGCLLLKLEQEHSAEARREVPLTATSGDGRVQRLHWRDGSKFARSFDQRILQELYCGGAEGRPPVLSRLQAPAGTLDGSGW